MASKNILFLLVVLVGIATNIQDVIAKPPSKITGGDVAEITEFPSIVSIRYAKSHICGGAIIAKNKILTAAHCLTSENEKTGNLKETPVSLITIGTGSKYSKEMKNIYKAKKFDIHEKYTGNMTENAHDIAIITLVEDIKEDSTQKIIALPTKDIRAGESGFVAGWGSEREYGKASPLLQKAPMTIITNAKCQTQINDLIVPGHLCAIHKLGVGFCDGDSGGPLIINDQIVGVVSMSIDCGKGYPDIYSRVYTYLDWIREKMQS